MKSYLFYWRYHLIVKSGENHLPEKQAYYQSVIELKLENKIIVNKGLGGVRRTLSNICDGTIFSKKKLVWTYI